ncbi:MAG TPA: hypothetical protein VIC60_13105, partial [Thermomicrobiales bacterium]
RSVTGAMQPHLAAYRAAFLTAAAFAVIGALIALTVPDRDAAATMLPRAKRDTPAASQEALVPDVG